MQDLLLRIFSSANRAAYRATGGKVGGSLRGAPVLLLTTTGRKTGKPRTKPLLYLREDGSFVVIASKGGAAKHPAWFLNLRAHPEVEVEVGRERRQARARVAEGEERALLWTRAVEMYGPYRDYQAKTRRQIPVVVLEAPAAAA